MSVRLLTVLLLAGSLAFVSPAEAARPRHKAKKPERKGVAKIQPKNALATPTALKLSLTRTE